MFTIKKIKTLLLLNNDKIIRFKCYFKKFMTSFLALWFFVIHWSILPSEATFENSYLLYFIYSVTLVSSLYCLSSMFSYSANDSCLENNDFNRFLKFNAAMISLEYVLIDYGDVIYEYALNNQEKTIAIMAGVIITIVINKIFMPKDTESFDSIAVSRGITAKQLPSASKMYKRTKKQENLVAVHEVGHAIFHAGANIMPSTFEINVIGNDKAEGFVRTFSDRNLDYSKDKIWSMYMLLGGYCAEKHFLGDHGFGCNSDLRRWERLAIRYLIHSEKVHYYSLPKNDIELKHNANLLIKLRNIQMKRIEKFFESNKKLFMEIVEEVKRLKILNNDAMKPFLDLVKWDNSIERLNLPK